MDYKTYCKITGKTTLGSNTLFEQSKGKKLPRLLIASGVAVVALAGCTTGALNYKDIFKYEASDRVINRNLLTNEEINLDDEHIYSHVDSKTDHRERATRQDSDAQPAFVDVEFYNESAYTTDKDVVSKIKSTLGSERYLVVGHSHGKSALGVETLSSKRARHIARLLIESGIPKENVFFLSSWSDGGMPYDIAKGVRVFSMERPLTREGSLLTGINI